MEKTERHILICRQLCGKKDLMIDLWDEDAILAYAELSRTRLGKLCKGRGMTCMLSSPCKYCPSTEKRRLIFS